MSANKSTPSRRALPTTALVTLLVLSGIALLPAPADASAGDFFDVYPGRGSLVSEGTVTVCPPSGQGANPDRFEYFFNATYGNVRVALDTQSSVLEQRLVDDDEQCGTWLLEGRGGQFFGVGYTDDNLGGQFHWTIIAVGNVSSAGGASQQDVTLSGETATTGFTSFDTRVPQLLFLGLLILAYWNRWYMAGTVALAAAIATEFTGGPGTLDYTFGYVGYALFVALEAFGQRIELVQKVRGFVEDRGDAGAGVGR